VIDGIPSTIDPCVFVDEDGQPYIYISGEMTPISIGGEKQASISGGSHLPADINIEL